MADIYQPLNAKRLWCPPSYTLSIVKRISTSNDLIIRTEKSTNSKTKHIYFQHRINESTNPRTTSCICIKHVNAFRNHIHSLNTWKKYPLFESMWNCGNKAQQTWKYYVLPLLLLYSLPCTFGKLYNWHIVAFCLNSQTKSDPENVDSTRHRPFSRSRYSRQKSKKKRRCEHWTVLCGCNKHINIGKRNSESDEQELLNIWSSIVWRTKLCSLNKFTSISVMYVQW